MNHFELRTALQDLPSLPGPEQQGPGPDEADRRKN